LRITHKDYPPFRSTLDLYTDSQTDKLIRTLCDKWGVTLVKSSKSVHALICQLENYKLEHLRYPQGDKDKTFEMSGEEEQAAKAYLTSNDLIPSLQKDLQHIGILGEDENALTLFLAMASHKSDNPFSVLCLAKCGIGKSYLLKKLSDCMPRNAYSFHTQISENARATKNKDGMIHSTTFEVSGKLCLIACAYAEKNYEQLSLPFCCCSISLIRLLSLISTNVKRLPTRTQAR